MMGMAKTEIIYHIISPAEWATAQERGEYEPSSIEAEGFIHFSTAEQVPATSLRHYADAGELLVMSIAVDRLAGELVWENLTDTGTYPHLYQTLGLDAVLDVAPYVAGDPVSQPRDASSARPSPES